MLMAGYYYLSSEVDFRVPAIYEVAFSAVESVPFVTVAAVRFFRVTGFIIA